MELAATIASRMGFRPGRVDDIRTVVAEATINAIEHGNAFDPTRSVVLHLAPYGGGLEICIADHCAEPVMCETANPCLSDKLALTSPHRGWGLFLIRTLADGVEFSSTDNGNVLRITISPELPKACDTSATGV